MTFTEGLTADMMIDADNMTTLMNAVTQWQSPTDAAKAQAVKGAKIFLRKVTPKHYDGNWWAKELSAAPS